MTTDIAVLNLETTFEKNGRDFEELVDQVIAISMKCREFKADEDAFNARELTFKAYFNQHIDLIHELRAFFPTTKGTASIKGTEMTWAQFCDTYFGVTTQWVAEQFRELRKTREEKDAANARAVAEIVKSIVPPPAPVAVPSSVTEITIPEPGPKGDRTQEWEHAVGNWPPNKAELQKMVGLLRADIRHLSAQTKLARTLAESVIGNFQDKTCPTVKIAQNLLKFLDAKLTIYQCSACMDWFEVTADRVPPHYAALPATHGTWHKPISSPDIAGWSAMRAAERRTAARAAGCPYCLKFDSARSCPAHGWVERSPNSNWNGEERQ